MGVPDHSCTSACPDCEARTWEGAPAPGGGGPKIELKTLSSYPSRVDSPQRERPPGRRPPPQGPQGGTPSNPPWWWSLAAVGPRRLEQSSELRSPNQLWAGHFTDDLHIRRPSSARAPSPGPAPLTYLPSGVRCRPGALGRHSGTSSPWGTHFYFCGLALPLPAVTHPGASHGHPTHPACASGSP